MIPVFVFVFVAWIISLSFHEFSHALVAYWGGDRSVRDKGYLTFNPLKYTHPVLTFLMPILFLAMGGIGLPGGAVYIERDRLRGPAWNAAVSLAGPLSNALLGVLLAIPFAFGMAPAEPKSWIWPALAFLCELQVTAFLFNLIPVPPLDGYGFVSAWLPRETRRQVDAFSGQAFWILLLILWFYPPANAALWKVIFTVLEAIGVPPQLAFDGFQLFRFWSGPGSVA